MRLRDNRWKFGGARQGERFVIGKPIQMTKSENRKIGAQFRVRDFSVASRLLIALVRRYFDSFVHWLYPTACFLLFVIVEVVVIYEMFKVAGAF